MACPLESRTLTVSIACDADAVYQFVSNPANLTLWATAFCKSIRQADSEWIMETNSGPMKVRFVPPNDYRVADHFVSPAQGVEIHVPMRVLQNGSGSEVTFTLFHAPDTPPEKFAEDIRLVTQDLQTLKRGLEK